MSIIDGARALRAVILQAVLSLDDKAASAAPALFPRLLEDGSLVRAGTRICWNGRIKRAASDLWDRPENNPDNAPNLWEDIAYREGFRIIPDTITTTTAFFSVKKDGGMVCCMNPNWKRMSGHRKRIRTVGRLHQSDNHNTGTRQDHR